MPSASEEGHGPGAGVGSKGTKSKGKDQENRDRQPTVGGASTAKSYNADPNKSGKASTQAGATPPGSLPPGLNPAKYPDVNPNVSYEATPSNLAKAVGTLIGGVALPGAVGPIGQIAGEAMGLTDSLGLGYDNPTGIVGGSEMSYDAAQIKPGVSPGQTTSTFGTDTIRSPLQSQTKKKKDKPGITLLSGAGGTLLGT